MVGRDLPVGRFARLEEFERVETRLGRALTEVHPEGVPVLLAPVFKTPSEVEQGSPLFLDMVEDAQVLYDPDGFLAAYLAGLRARLQALGARRIWLGNAWYWELKPDLQPGEVIVL